MIKRLLYFVLACAIVIQSGVTAFAAEEQIVLLQEQYCDKETRSGSSAIEIIDDQEVFDYFEGIRETTGYELVSATRQTVYVIETIDDVGNVEKSRLMTNQEVSEYNERILSGQTTGNTWVGEDNEEHQGGKLSIYLVVYKDSSQNYYAYGTADWENGIYIGGINGPSSGYDFIALTWGGSGELKNSSSSDRSISGRYQYDQGAISFSRAQSDTYCGYCWQFNEKTGIYFADYIDCYAKLTKTYSTYRGKETNIRLTYVHTYQSSVGTISFTAGTSSVAAGVSLSSCEKQWQIEVDIPGIYY